MQDTNEFKTLDLDALNAVRGGLDGCDMIRLSR